MADGHFTDVELLRRELATLILEWAGKAVKDDPDGPMSTALTRAVSEAARNAVIEQHQVLDAEAADRIAEALERRSRPGPLGRRWVLPTVAIVAIALLAIAFFLGLRVGRSEGVTPTASAATGVNAPIAPLAPSVDEPAPSQASTRVTETKPPARPQRVTPPPAKPAIRSTPHDLGRPAQASDGAASGTTQPVGAATTPAAQTTAPKP
jgi:hypothetical protein